MKIFFDIDGVLADFNKGVFDLCGITVPDQQSADKAADNAMWNAIRDTKHFYDRLEPVSGMPELFMELFQKYGKDCQILTAISKEKRGIVTAEEDKRSWVKRVLGPEVTVNVVLREEKKNYCKGRDSVLIDDLAPNIKEWELFGGTGILFVNAEQTRDRLKTLTVLETTIM